MSGEAILQGLTENPEWQSQVWKNKSNVEASKTAVP